MNYIRKIQISGFRGILSPLPIDFMEGKTCKSMIIYGLNGTGKSSITDAWEWLINGKIEHLAKEGAEESSYPHKFAKPGKSYVEVEFSDSKIGTVRLEYDHSRITKPKEIGNIGKVRQMITHPCHIRYGDLTRFVFMRKAERYDALAELMGFSLQMEYQKSLRRVQTILEKEVNNSGQLMQGAGSVFKDYFELSQIDTEKAFRQIAQLYRENGIEIGADLTLKNLRETNQQLQNKMVQDLKATILADYQTLEASLRACEISSDIVPQLKRLRDAIGDVKSTQKELLAEQLLVPIFKSADAFLSKIDTSGKCPLCGKYFDGNLHEHVKNELARLKQLQLSMDNLRQCREALSTTVNKQINLVYTFDNTLGLSKPAVEESSLNQFHSAAEKLDNCFDRLKELLVFDSTALTDELVESYKREEVSFTVSVESFENAKSTLLKETQIRKEDLNKDPLRLKLVNDAQFINTGLSYIAEYFKRESDLNKAKKVLDEYTFFVNSYVSACLADVQRRFDEISDKVCSFFELLEKYNSEICKPKLKLQLDQDRSVVLEIGFYGDTINPAYKYLSESQLNSFGLSVFLASAIHFNKDCRFIILDDVVNSFDAYKRPLVIEIIKNHINDHQILLMTHDRFWRDLLNRHLPHWKHMDFNGYEFGVGPLVSKGMLKLEKVKNALDYDEPDDASRTLFIYLEDMLQDICEKFECDVKFNRRNEFTLDTLLDRLRVRLQNKLGETHKLTRIVSDIFSSNAYRNWLFHCKNPVSPIQKNEVKEVMEKWMIVESMVICQEESCFDILKYDGKGAFCCPCGKTRVQK